MDAAELPGVAELLPHRGGMLLLERLLEHDGESTAARVAVGSRGWLTGADGSVPSWLAVEYMAQCVAAHEGMLARAQGRPPPRGLLVAAFEVRLRRARFGAHERLRVRARRLRGRVALGALSHVCAVHAEAGGDADAPLAEGRLSISVLGAEADPSPRGRSAVLDRRR